jgi:CRP-like cAMP-binding protein
VLLRTVNAGSAIGEMGLFRDAPRSATARAADTAHLFRLSREKLAHLAKHQPVVHAQLCRQLLVQMASRIDRLDMQANALAR